jgi:hypothetical protein
MKPLQHVLAEMVVTVQITSGKVQSCGSHPILLVFRTQFEEAAIAFRGGGELTRHNLEAGSLLKQRFVQGRQSTGPGDVIESLIEVSQVLEHFATGEEQVP